MTVILFIGMIEKPDRSPKTCIATSFFFDPFDTGSVDREVLVAWTRAILLLRKLKDNTNNKSLIYVPRKANRGTNEWAINSTFFKNIDEKVDIAVNHWTDGRFQDSCSVEEFSVIMP